MSLAAAIEVVADDPMIFCDAFGERALGAVRLVDCAERSFIVQKTVCQPGSVKIITDNLPGVVYAGRDRIAEYRTVCAERIIDRRKGIVLVEKSVRNPARIDVKPNDLPIFVDT